ncbi:MAG: hypothetical protein AAFY56_23825, partial [Pseudomonadota bacterium]
MNQSTHGKIIAKLNEVNWEYAPHDMSALTIMKERIAQTGKKFGLISYSDLASCDIRVAKLNTLYKIG